MQSVLNKYVCVSLFLTSTLFASQPPALGSAVQLAKKCTNESHTLVLAEQQKIADEIRQSNTSLLTPLASIVASYCAMPMQWQKKRELRLLDDQRQRYVCSIAELSAQKIAVSYDPHQALSSDKVVSIWNLRDVNPVPDCQTLKEILRTKYSFNGYLVSIADGVVGNLKNGTLHLVNTQKNKISEISLNDASICCVSVPTTYCALGTNKGAVLILAQKLNGELEACSAESPLFHTFAISTLCPLPNSKLAVGDARGRLLIFDCAAEAWEEPLRVGKDATLAIAGWPDGIIAVVFMKLNDRFETVKRIECWDTQTNTYLGSLTLEFPNDSEICALPDRRLATVLASESGLGFFDRIKIYKIITDNAPDGSAKIRAELEQELSFQDDEITQRAPDMHSYFPLYLSKTTWPTMAIGTKSGAVHIYEQAACPNCEQEKPANSNG